MKLSFFFFLPDITASGALLPFIVREKQECVKTLRFSLLSSGFPQISLYGDDELILKHDSA